MAERTLRIRLLIIVVAFCALGGVAHFAVRFVSTDPLRTLVEENLSQALGLAVSIDKFEATLLPTPHLHAEVLRVANAPGRSTPNVLTIERVELEFEFWPLLQRIVVLKALEIEGADLYIETDSAGNLPGDFELSALVNDEDQDSVRFELREVNIERMRVFYRDAHRDISTSLILDSAALKSKELGTEIAMDIQGRFEGSEFALEGRIGSLRELLKRTQPFPIDLRGRLFEANFEAKGSIREPWAFKGFDVEFSGEIPKLVVRDVPLPQLGVIDLGGHLSDLDGSLGLDRLTLHSTKTSPVRIVAHGEIDDLLTLKDVEIELDVETKSIEFMNALLQELVDFPLPPIASLSVKTKLSDRDGSLDLDGTIHAATSNDAIVIHAEGGIHDLIGDAKLDLRLSATADDLALITSLVPDIPIPIHGGLGKVHAKGHLKSHGDILAASAIEIRVGDRQKTWAELDGSIGDVIQFQNVDFELGFGVQSLHHLNELLAREFPRTSKLEGSAALNDKDGSLGLEYLRLHGGEDSPIEIHLEAHLDDLVRRDEIEIELKLRVEDTRLLGAMVGLDLPVIRPVEFHGKVKGSEKHIEVENMTLRLGQTRLLGTLSGSFARGTRPKIRARLTSKDVRLQDLGLVPTRNASTRLTPIARLEIENSRGLSFEDLRRVDLDLELRFDHVGGYMGLEVNDVGFKLRLDDGNLVVTNAGARYQGGDLSANLHIDARTPHPKLEARLQTRGLDIARLMAQVERDTEYTGTFDIDLELHATGNTFDAHRRSLRGNITASMRDGNAASRISHEFVVNLSEVVFPGYQESETPTLSCAIVDLGIENGIASVRTLLLQGEDLGVVGTGKIDLIHGLYDLHVVPKMRNPGILSVAPEVDITGPLHDPEFHPRRRTIITSFGRGFIHNARTILFPFGKKSRNFVDDCRAPSSESD